MFRRTATPPATSAPAAPATKAPAPQQAPAQPAGPAASQQQALDSAQSYLSDGQGFSRAGLIQQLSSSAGEQFTYAQAVYAAGQVGL
jgi:hypothetical protein